MSSSHRPLAGRCCVITGATSGLGRATALALAGLGAELVLTGRNVAEGRRVANRCQALNPTGRAAFLPADLAELPEVRTLAAAILERTGRVDVLVNNAGARLDHFAANRAGMERTFAGNHLGHFLLTHLLRPALEGAEAGRVITVGSCAHAVADLSRGWLSSAEHYDRRVAYANSKLANVIFARELGHRWRPGRIVSNAVDPGLVATRFARNNGWVSWLKHLVAHGLRGELVSARAAADTIVYLATAEEVRQANGGYYHRRREITPSPKALDPIVAGELWRLSLEWSGLANPNGT